MTAHQPGGEGAGTAERDQQGRPEQAVDPAMVQHPVHGAARIEPLVADHAQAEARADAAAKRQGRVPTLQSASPQRGELLDARDNLDQPLDRPEIELRVFRTQGLRALVGWGQGRAPAQRRRGQRPPLQARADPPIGDAAARRLRDQGLQVRHHVVASGQGRRRPCPEATTW